MREQKKKQRQWDFTTERINWGMMEQEGSEAKETIDQEKESFQDKTDSAVVQLEESRDEFLGSLPVRSLIEE